jgi:hypothetical protein
MSEGAETCTGFCMPHSTSLRDAYRFPGFQPAQRVREEGPGFIVPLSRRRKKVTVVAADLLFAESTIPGNAKHAISIVQIAMSFWSSFTVGSFAPGVA